jgi:hypothetical protein
MYLIPIGWLYVALMMSVAEATNSNGTVLGAAVTFVLYGLLPVALVWYFMGTPGRKRKIRAQEMAERDAWQQRQFVAGPPQDELAPSGGSDPRSGGAWGPTSNQPDAGSESPADTVPPVGKEP